MSNRGSAYLEYAVVATVVMLVASMAFRPGSAVNSAFGADFATREILLKLPLF